MTQVPSSRPPVPRLHDSLARPVFLLACAALVLSACAGGAPARKSGPVPVTQGKYKVGSPYKIRGNWYHPVEDWDYDQVGVASWYGHPFHGRKTANGETFNKEALTAAHPTLPLPSRVRVTNLANGKSIIVRVNDRGPFAHGRIIDMSERSAEVLGFKLQGTAKVRVEAIGKAPVRIAKHDDGASLNARDATFALAEAPQTLAPAPVRAPVGVAPAAPIPPARSMAPVADSVAVPVSPAIRAPTYRYAPQSPVQPAPIPSPRVLAGAAPRPNTAGAAVPERPAVASQPLTAPGAEPEPLPVAAAGFAVLPRRAPEVYRPEPTAAHPAPKPPRPLYVQAGAFSDRDNAERLRSTLMAMGNTAGSVAVTPLKTDAGYLYRVRLGPMVSVDEADQARRQLAALGHTGAQIIVE